MTIVIAAISMVTSSIIPHLINIDIPLKYSSASLLFITTIILIISDFNWFNKMIKWLIITLSLLTFISAIYLMFDHTISVSLKEFSLNSSKDILFLVALVGWMPAPLDISIVQSIWVNEDKTKSKSLFDFKIGYWTTTILAICFLILGAKTMFGKTINTNSAIKFTFELIDMYTSVLGEFAFPIIALICFITMYSTTITVMDAYPKMVINTNNLTQKPIKQLKNYKRLLIFTSLISWTIINYFLNSFKMLIDFVTTISFILTPLLALLNLISLQKGNIPDNSLWSNYEYKIAKIFLVFISIFTIYYFWITI